MRRYLCFITCSVLLILGFSACHQKADPYYYGPGFVYATGRAQIHGEQPQQKSMARSAAISQARTALEKKVLAHQVDRKTTVRTLVKDDPSAARKLEKFIQKAKIASEKQTQDNWLEIELEFDLRQIDKLTK